MRCRTATLPTTVLLSRAGTLRPRQFRRMLWHGVQTRPVRPVGAKTETIRAAADGRHAGQLIGPYRLLRLLGQGGMATVWLALWTDAGTDGGMERLVALKMPALKLVSPLQIERFDRERDFLGMLEHPGVARLLDAGLTPASEPYIAMEFVGGQGIVQACDQRGLSIAQRIDVFLQVLAAVDYIHRHCIVHRDIKPSNVFLDEKGQVKLLDFGIAKALSASSGLATASPLTQEGGLALTPQYAAPEQFADGMVSKATDIYALGVLLYELLTGRTPHAGDGHSMGSMLHAVLYRQALPPSRAALGAADDVAARCRGLSDRRALADAIGTSLDAVVLRAISKAAIDRYASAADFAQALRLTLTPQPAIRARFGWCWSEVLTWLRTRLNPLAPLALCSVDIPLEPRHSGRTHPALGVAVAPSRVGGCDSN